MPDILRTTAIWNGIAGAPGYTVLSWGPGGGSVTEAADSATAAMRTFFDGIKAYLPTACSIQVSAECPLLDAASGHLTQVATASSTPALVIGTAGLVVAAPAGAAITWLTAAIRNTHRLRGRTYLVPLSTAAYEANGSLVAGAITAISGAAATLRTTVATPLQVWGRPTPGVANGVTANVTGHTLRDKVAVLRSRRD